MKYLEVNKRRKHFQFISHLDSSFKDECTVKSVMTFIKFPEKQHNGHEF